MALKVPTSMNDLLYFTNRKKDKLAIKAWVYKKQCPKCKKSLMGKPLNDDTGRVKIRAIEYICPSCNYTEAKVVHEESLMLQAQYTCPECGNSGEATAPYKRKTYMGVPSILLECDKCHAKIPVTKKLRDPKKKKGKAVAVSEEDADDADAL